MHDDDEDDDSLMSKLKRMNREQLAEYARAAKLAAGIINVLGVTTILLALIFPNIFMIVGAVWLVFEFGKASSQIAETKEYIRSRLDK